MSDKKTKRYIDLSDLKTHRWSLKLKEEGYIVKNQLGEIVCRILIEDYKKKDSSVFALTAKLIQITPQLFESYTDHCDEQTKKLKQQADRMAEALDELHFVAGDHVSNELTKKAQTALNDYRRIK